MYQSHTSRLTELWSLPRPAQGLNTNNNNNNNNNIYILLINEHNGDVSPEKKDRHYRHKSNIQARPRNHCKCGKAINITHSECVSVALLSSLACQVIPYFFPPNYLTNGTIFEKKKRELLNVKCILVFSTTLLLRIISHSNKK